MSSLFDLTAEISRLEDWLDDCDERGVEFSHAQGNKISQFLDSLGEQRDSKLDGYAYLIRKLEHERDAADEEKRAWEAKKKSREARIKWLKENLRLHMEAVNQRKIETGKFRFSVCKNGGVSPLEIDDKALPGEFFYQPPAMPDSTLIRQRVEAGESIAGVKVLPKGTHVRIK